MLPSACPHVQLSCLGHPTSQLVSLTPLGVRWQLKAPAIILVLIAIMAPGTSTTITETPCTASVSDSLTRRWFRCSVNAVPFVSCPFTIGLLMPSVLPALGFLRCMAPKVLQRPCRDDTSVNSFASKPSQHNFQALRHTCGPKRPLCPASSRLACPLSVCSRALLLAMCPRPRASTH
jgi:hypothetical protein